MSENKSNLIHECPMCDGGTVDLHINGEHVETITCPDCHGTGTVSGAFAAKIHNCINAFNKALADERVKY